MLIFMTRHLKRTVLLVAAIGFVCYLYATQRTQQNSKREEVDRVLHAEALSLQDRMQEVLAAREWLAQNSVRLGYNQFNVDPYSPNRLFAAPTTPPARQSGGRNWGNLAYKLDDNIAGFSGGSDAGRGNFRYGQSDGGEGDLAKRIHREPTPPTKAAFGGAVPGNLAPGNSAPAKPVPGRSVSEQLPWQFTSGVNKNPDIHQSGPLWSQIQREGVSNSQDRKPYSDNQNLNPSPLRMNTNLDPKPIPYPKSDSLWNPANPNPVANPLIAKASPDARFPSGNRASGGAFANEKDLLSTGSNPSVGFHPATNSGTQFILDGRQNLKMSEGYLGNLPQGQQRTINNFAPLNAVNPNLLSRDKDVVKMSEEKPIVNKKDEKHSEEKSAHGTKSSKNKKIDDTDDVKKRDDKGHDLKMEQQPTNPDASAGIVSRFLAKLLNSDSDDSETSTGNTPTGFGSVKDSVNAPTNYAQNVQGSNSNDALLPWKQDTAGLFKGKPNQNNGAAFFQNKGSGFPSAQMQNYPQPMGKDVLPKFGGSQPSNLQQEPNPNSHDFSGVPQGFNGPPQPFNNPAQQSSNFLQESGGLQNNMKAVPGSSKGFLQGGLGENKGPAQASDGLSKSISSNNVFASLTGQRPSSAGQMYHHAVPAQPAGQSQQYGQQMQFPNGVQQHQQQQQQQPQQNLPQQQQQPQLIAKQHQQQKPQQSIQNKPDFQRLPTTTPFSQGILSWGQNLLNMINPMGTNNEEDNTPQNPQFSKRQTIGQPVTAADQLRSQFGHSSGQMQTQFDQSQSQIQSRFDPSSGQMQTQFGQSEGQIQSRFDRSPGQMLPQMQSQFGQSQGQIQTQFGQSRVLPQIDRHFDPSNFGEDDKEKKGGENKEEEKKTHDSKKESPIATALPSLDGAVMITRDNKHWKVDECKASAIKRQAVTLNTPLGQVPLYVDAYTQNKTLTPGSRQPFQGTQPVADSRNFNQQFGMRWNMRGIRTLFERCLLPDPNTTLIDVGSGVGKVAFTASIAGHTVLAVEPLEWRAQTLCNTVTDFRYPNVHVIHNAASDDRGKVHFRTVSSQQDKDRYVVDLRNKSKIDPNSPTAFAIRLDDVLRVFKVTKAVLRIEAGGLEGRVLVGAHKIITTLNIPCIFMEWKYAHDVKEFGGAYIFDVLSRFGFFPHDVNTLQPLKVFRMHDWPDDVLWAKIGSAPVRL